MKKIFLAVCFLLLMCISAHATDTIVYGLPSGISAGDATYANLTANETLGDNVVSIPTACTGWTLGAGWNGTCTGNALIKDSDGTGTASFDASESAGVKYKVVYTLSGLSGGNITASMSGVTDTPRSSNGTYTWYVRGTSTANLTFTPSATGVRVNITPVSVQIVSDGKLTSYNDITAYGGQFLASNGSSTYVPYSFIDSPSSGLRYLYADTAYIGVLIGGVARLTLSSTTAELKVTNIYFGTNLDTIMSREAANGLQLGSDTSTASNQTISAADSTGASQNGANLILEGGDPGSGGIEGKIQFNSVTQMNEPDAAAVEPTRTSKRFDHVRTLVADANDACGGTDDCLTLPIPTSTGRCEIWYSTFYMLAILASDGTATVITDSDAAGTDIEYNAAIGACTGVCLHDGGTNSIIFNDTAGAVTVHVSCVYD